MVPPVGHPGSSSSAGWCVLRVFYLRRRWQRLLHARLDHHDVSQRKRVRVLRKIQNTQPEDITVEVSVHVSRSARQQRLLHPRHRLQGLRFGKLNSLCISVQGDSGGWHRFEYLGWVDIDLDVPPSCTATQPILSISLLPGRNSPTVEWPKW